MRTLRPTVLSLALTLVFVACTGEPSSIARGDLEVDADVDTTEVLSTSEATVDASGPGVDEVLPAVVASQVSVAELRPTPEAVDVPPAARFTLRRGETLAHYARWAELPVETIAKASELDLDGQYAVGTEVAVPIGDEGLATLTERREEHHRARAEAYLASRGGSSGNLLVEVRTGDTAWSIAKDNEAIPVWLLESLNPTMDLDRLRPGQSLVVPRIGEGTVASVEEPVEDVEPEVDLLAGEEDVNEGLIVVDEEVRVLPELIESGEDSTLE